MTSVDPSYPPQPVGDEQKFKQLLLFIAWELRDDPRAGATKINKALYYAEFGHVRATGGPISGVEYQRLKRGPAPRRLRPLRDEMIREGKAELVETTYRGYKQHRIVPSDEPDTSCLSEEEKRSVKEALEELRILDGTGVSTLSHEEIGWQMVADGETIPFSTAYLREPVSTEQTRARTKQLAERFGLL